MFDSAELILDVYGRPIFVLPIELSQEQIKITVKEDCLLFFSDNNKIGEVSDLMDEMLLLVASQKEVGIISYPDINVECPDHLTHIAQIKTDELKVS